MLVITVHLYNDSNILLNNCYDMYGFFYIFAIPYISNYYIVNHNCLVKCVVITAKFCLNNIKTWLTTIKKIKLNKTQSDNPALRIDIEYMDIVRDSRIS